ncbi:MAG: RNA-binding protein [Fuerstiella sp.]
MTNIYVGNLSYDTSSGDLENAFAEFGNVSRATVVSDRETGRSKGFGFVDMPDQSAAESAIDALNDQPLDGRTLRVNVATPREDRPRR